MQRPSAEASGAAVYAFGPFELDCGQGILSRHGEIVPLTPKLVDTLAVLVAEAGRVVSRDTLLATVWPDVVVSDSNLTQSVWLLRRALEQDGERYIETLARRGYRFLGRVRRLEQASRTADASGGASGERPVLPAALPRPATALVGREREIAEIASLLAGDAGRLITLLGPGGAGKTRLALEVASRLAPNHADGAVFIDLSRVTHAAAVPAVMARALAIEEDLFRPTADLVREALAARRALVVLDNCEQLAEDGALFAELHAAAPSVSWLVTSRIRLRLAAEQVYVVPALSLPRAGAAAAEVAASEAVALFIARARAQQPTFGIDDRNAAAIAEICAALDGLPLALELAAARLRLLSLAGIQAELGNRLRLLGGGPRDAGARQQTLRATLDWSHPLLSLRQQALLRRLAVFAGSFTLDAALAVAGVDDGHGDSDSLDDLHGLLDASWIVAAPSGERARFRMLETLREYATERLLASGEADAVRAAHARWFAAAAGRAAEALASPGAGAAGRSGSPQNVALDELERDHDNLRAALADLAARDADAALALVAALGPFWHRRGHWQEALIRTERALAAAPAAPDAVRAAALLHLGRLNFFLGAEDVARGQLEAGLVAARRAGDAVSIARLLDALAQAYLKVADDARAAAALDEALGLARHASAGPAVTRPPGSTAALAEVLTTLGMLRAGAGEHAAARASLAEGLALARALGDGLLVARALYYLAGLALLDGDDAEAAALAEQAVAGAADAGDASWAHHLSEMHGRALVAVGETERAAPLIAASLGAMDAVGSRTCVPHGLEAAARLALARGDVDGAAHLLGAVESGCEALGIAMLPLERALLGQTEDAWRAAARRRRAAWKAGRAWSLEEALRRALALCASVPV